ncbi:MAG: BatD family protein [Bradymonadaceae bacterium]|nr:BatD family protein [Lujinxingiaceae bacterium]
MPLDRKASRSLLAASAFLLIALSTAGSALAQPEAQIAVNVEPRMVEAGGQLIYTIDAVTEGNHEIRLLREPGFVAASFEVVGRMTAPQFIIRNGNARRQLTITYTLRAPETGTYRIEPPVLQVGASRFTPVSLDVKVVETSEMPGITQNRNQNMYLEVTVAPQRDPYIGEQILVAYDLYVDTRQTRVRPRPPSEPNLDAFWIEDVSEQIAGRRVMVTVGARLLEKTPLRAFAAFPLQTGEATIDSMTAPVVRGGFFGPTSDENLMSEQLTVNVKPLPPGAPPGFYEGNVGRWSFSVNADTTSTRVGAPITLTLASNGRGRSSRLRFAELAAIEGTRMVNHTHDTKREVRDLAIYGTRVEKITLIALAEGTLTIPSLELSYFDPELGQYQTVASEPININVEAGELPAEPQAADQDVARVSRHRGDIAAALAARLRPIVDDTEATAYTARAIFTLPAWWAATTVPLLGILLLVFGGPLLRFRPTSRSAKNAKKALWEAIHEHFAQASEASNSPASGYGALIGAMHTYFTNMLGVPPGVVTEGELRPHLARHGASPETQAELLAILAACNAVRFAPRETLSHKDLAALTARCREALLRLDAELTRQGHKPSAAAGPVLAILLATGMLLAFAPQPLYAETPHDAPSSETTENWAQSAQLWQTRAQAEPQNALLLLNAGTALAHDGQYALARHYLERASLLRPTHQAIKANLDIVRQIVAHQATSARTPLYSEALEGWRFGAAISTNLLLILLSTALWAIFLALLARRLVKATWARRSATAVIWAAALTIALVAAGGLTRYALTHDANPAIIVSAAPELREGPSTYASLHKGNTRPVAGMMVHVIEQRKGWTKVEIADGVNGWMQAHELLGL